MIAESTIEEVKARANLYEIVSEVVQLKRQGTRYLGLCPFHTEKTPSFHVRVDEGVYHCFGCGVSGNAISFLMRLSGLSFPEAVENLAQRYGIEVKRTGSVAPGRNLQVNEIYRINSLALSFFKQALQKADLTVRNYVQGRKITAQGMASFAIGLAPAEWHALSEILQSKKVPPDLMIAAGLARRSSRGELYDVFRGRLIFPVWLDHRRVAGFGGRIIAGLFPQEEAENQAKYLNCAETPVYHKSKVLYGFPQAFEAVRQSSEVYVVEGYMDVVGMWQSGCRNVVATCGTAMTEYHVRKLGRVTKRIKLLFDGDEAGRKAAARSFGLFLNSGVDTFALFLPQGEDPDSFAVKHGAHTTNALGTLPQKSLLECFLIGALVEYGVTEVGSLGAAAKGKIAEEIGGYLAQVKNSIEKGALLQQAAFLLRSSEDDLRALVEKGRPQVGTTEKSQARGAAFGLEKGADNVVLLPEARVEIKALPRLDQEVLLAVMARKGELSFEFLKDPDLCQGVSRITYRFISELAEILKLGNEAEEKAQTKTLLERYGLSWADHWRRAYAMRSDNSVDFLKAFEECRLSIRKNKINQMVKDAEKKLAMSGDEAERAALAQELLALNRRLKGGGAES